MPNRFARERNKTKVRTNKYAAFVAMGIPFSIFLVLGIPITLEILPASPFIFFIHPLLIVSSFAAMFVNGWSFQDVGLRLDGLTRNLSFLRSLSTCALTPPESSSLDGERVKGIFFISTKKFMGNPA